MILLSLVEHFLQLSWVFPFQVKQYKQTKKTNQTKKKKLRNSETCPLTLRTLRAEIVAWFPDCQLWFAFFKQSCAVPQRKHWKRVFLPHEFHPTWPTEFDGKLHGPSVWFYRSSCGIYFSFHRCTMLILRPQK